MTPTPPTLGFVLGAALQAQHALSLAHWIGVATDKTELFDDAWPERTMGALKRPITGTIADGLARVAEHRTSTLIAIGSRGAAFRFGLYRRLVAAEVPLLSLVHPSAFVAPDVVMGQNVLIMPGCVLSAQVRIGSLVCLFANVTLEHDAVLGDNVTLGPGVTLAGGAKVGPHAFLGAGAVMAPGVTVGAGTLVGAGAVVVRDLEPGVIAAGIPARVLRRSRAGDDVPTETELTRLLYQAPVQPATPT